MDLEYGDGKNINFLFKLCTIAVPGQQVNFFSGIWHLVGINFGPCRESNRSKVYSWIFCAID